TPLTSVASNVTASLDPVLPSHYRLLRLCEEESFILNSRDKAPFLFHFEISWIASQTIYDPDIYLARKTKEEILEEAIKLNQCENCKKMYSGKLMQNTTKSSSASSATATTTTD